MEAKGLHLASKFEDRGNDYIAETRLWLRLLTCTALLSSKLRKNFREEFDFTMPRFDLLAQLDREPRGLVMGELSKRLMVSAGNITPILSRLVEEGYIARMASKLDRRVQIVFLTAEGRKKFRRMAKKHGQWLNEILSKLDADELDAITKQLTRLKDVLKE